MHYIAAFYSHYGAVHYKSLCEELHIKAELMPVPRRLSSSCGTCVSYNAVSPCPCPDNTYPEEVEQVVQVDADGYHVIYRALHS